MKHLLISLLMLYLLLDVNPCTAQNASCPNDLQLSDDLSTGIFQAGNSISTSGTVLQNHTVSLKAGNEVSLETGFAMEANATFAASIENCAPISDNTISWINYPSLVAENQTYTVEISYTLAEPGLIHLILADENWTKIGEDWTVNLPAGSGVQTLSFTVTGAPSITTNYIQAKLLNTNWVEIGVNYLEEIIPGQSSYTNAIDFGTVLNTLEQGATYSIDIDYELEEPGLVYVQFMDENFVKIGEAWTTTLAAGLGITTLDVTVNGVPSIGNNYVQVQLLDANWGSLGVTPVQYTIIIDPPYSNIINALSILDTLEQGATYSLDVNYELADSGFVYVQFMNENFVKIGEAWTSMPPGPGIATLDVPVNGALSIGDNYVQAQLFDLSWGGLGANVIQYAITINSNSTPEFGLIDGSDPALTEYHTVFPIQYNTLEHGNPNPQSKQLQDAANSGNYYAYQSNWYVGGNWEGPIKAFFGPVSETGGLNFWMEWHNMQILDGNGNAPHSETDVRVQKHKWAWGSAERGYPKQLSALPATVNCTANGQWTAGSAGRAHINLTTWISSTDNIDDPMTERCDIIIHSWDNSGNMSANPSFNLIGTINDNGLVYDVIQRPGDEGEKASFNLVPRKDGLTMVQRSPILGDYSDTSPMDFSIDLNQIINQLMAMAVDQNGNPIFNNTWYLSGSDWTITAQSPATVGGVAIPASKGRWTFNSYNIPNLN